MSRAFLIPASGKSLISADLIDAVRPQLKRCALSLPAAFRTRNGCRRTGDRHLERPAARVLDDRRPRGLRIRRGLRDRRDLQRVLRRLVQRRPHRQLRDLPGPRPRRPSAAPLDRHPPSARVGQHPGGRGRVQPAVGVPGRQHHRRRREPVTAEVRDLPERREKRVRTCVRGRLQRLGRDRHVPADRRTAGVALAVGADAEQRRAGEGVVQLRHGTPVAGVQRGEVDLQQVGGVLDHPGGQPRSASGGWRRRTSAAGAGRRRGAPPPAGSAPAGHQSRPRGPPGRGPARGPASYR